MAIGDLIPLGNDTTLISHLSWAGGSFPFAGTEDVVISSNTTWSDFAGFRKVKKLTINAGVTLRIIRTPFFLFADEIEFKSTTSTIDISGYNYNDSKDPNATFTINNGGTGGGGGGLIIVVARQISGAAGKIKANGGNAASSGHLGGGGQGALAGAGVPPYVQKWGGNVGIGGSAAVAGYLHPLSNLMADGASAGGGTGGTGGGSGASYESGSGIGGGGAGTYAGSSSLGLTPRDLLVLALENCRGGGAGGSSTGQHSGGGGGGGIAVFYRQAAALPVLEAHGGTGSTGGSGGAGATCIVQV